MKALSSSLPLLIVACGGASTARTDLANERIAVLLSFDLIAGQTLSLAAALEYDIGGDVCPSLDLSVDLDGVSLAPSPNATDHAGKTCQVGFFLTAPPPPSAPQSTLHFVGGTVDTSFTVTRLLEPRRWSTTLKDGSVVHQGDTVDFSWTTDSDHFDVVGVEFINGANEIKVPKQLDGTTAHVLVPALPSGQWHLQIGAVVHASPVSCLGAVSCSTQITRQDTVMVVAP